MANSEPDVGEGRPRPGAVKGRQGTRQGGGPGTGGTGPGRRQLDENGNLRLMPPKRRPAPVEVPPEGQPEPLPPGRAPESPPGSTAEDETLAFVPPARLQGRHRRLFYSFLLLVCLPLLLAASYLGFVAQDQYASTVGFTVRREDSATAASLLGGLSQLAGGGGSSETDILYEYIQSQEIVSAIEERIGLSALYSKRWPDDPVFALWPDPTAEDLLAHWGRMVRISYDSASQLIQLRVHAFTAEDSQRIAAEVLAESQKMINELNRQAREDIMRYANEDVAKTVERLKAAREAMSRFRSRTQIVDPAADVAGRMGVLNTLQQQLAEALIESDIIRDTTQADDPRRGQAARKISVIRDRIAEERASFAATTHDASGESYTDVLAEFERLTVDMEFAEETYRAALAAQDAARDQAVRQSVYLAAYIQPTLPQVAEYPQRLVLTALLALFLGLGWTVGALIFYAIRDRQ